MYTLEQLKPGYLALWNKCKVVRTAATQVQVNAINRAKTRLQAMEQKTGVPWYVIGALQVREAGLVNGNLDFKAVLHNGERIVGTGRKTVLVPAGRGPFATWEQSAYDAIMLQGLNKLDWKGTDWVASVAFAAESFNGFGYRMYHGIPSPYLWGGTNVQMRGKYTSDGHYDASVMDPQIGIMAILKSFQQQQPSTDKSVIPAVIVSTATASATVAVSQSNSWLDYWPYMLAGGIGVGIVIGLIYHFVHTSKGDSNAVPQ